MSCSDPPKQGAKRTLADGMLQILFGSLSKSIRILFVVYIIVSLVYTFAHFFTLFHPGKTINDGTGGSSAKSIPSQTVTGKIVLENNDIKPHSVWTGKFSLVAESDQHSVNSFPATWLNALPENLIFSKLFQYSLQPSKIAPYFFKMSPPPGESEITITTMITIERLSVLSSLVEKYKGPISVTLHLPDNEKKLAILEQLHEIYRSNPLYPRYIDMHLIIDNFDRQFNLWRNVARMFARTSLIMAMDVDFMLCSDLRLNFAKISKESQDMVLNGTAVFIVPAFEMSKEAPELGVDDYPSTKSELMRLVERKEVVMFHEKWQRGHGPTNYALWYQKSEPYRVTEYNYNYEPYVLMRRDGLPWCDERFVGYGANKAACLYEIFLSGTQFWVMPDDFLIHQRHPYPENDRRIERKYNKRLYDAYREETCVRYGRMLTKGPQNDSAVDERICGANFHNFF